MKHKLFGKNTALVMGALLAFSGHALAFSANNQEFSDLDPLHNSKIIIAQGAIGCDETVEPGVGVAAAVSVLIRALDQSIAAVRKVSVTEQFPLEAKEAVILALEDVRRNVVEALASAEVGDNVAVATAVSQVISVVTGVEELVAPADADAAQTIATATACANQAQAVAGAEAREI